VVGDLPAVLVQSQTRAAARRPYPQDDEVEAVLRRAAGRVVLLYLPTYSPWLNPIEPTPTIARRGGESA
jgi:transposase